MKYYNKKENPLPPTLRGHIPLRVPSLEGVCGGRWYLSPEGRSAGASGVPASDD